MELNDFMIKFLPDEEITGVLFMYEHFPEALQNYTDKICAKQRENCVDVYCLNDDVCPLENDIRNSEQPETEEL